MPNNTELNYPLCVFNKESWAPSENHNIPIMRKADSGMTSMSKTGHSMMESNEHNYIM